MNGHLSLINLRANGIRPRAVWLLDTDVRGANTLAGDWWQQRNVADRAWHAHIRLTADDIPEALDLRYLTGLLVHVCSERAPDRFYRICRAALAAGAAHVVGVCEGAVFSEHQPKEPVTP